MTSSIKLVTFDITGTLLRGRRSVGEQYAETLQKVANITCDPNRITKSFRQVFKLHNDAYPIFGKSAGLSTKAWWRSVFLGTLVASNTISPSQLQISQEKHQNHLTSLWQVENHSSAIAEAFNILYQNFGYEALPHAHELLNYLKVNSTVVLGVISNNDERIETALALAGFHDYFDFALTSTKCGFEKPDKRIFEYALKLAGEKLSLDNPIPSYSVVHIGDNLKEDYQGAIEAGFRTAFLIDPNDEFRKIINPDHCAKDLSVVFHKLMKILS